MPFSFEGSVLDPACRELRRAGEVVPLEPQVFDLLDYLVRHRERVVSRDELIANVWRGRVVSDSTLDSRVNAARRAVGDSGSAQRLIRTYPRKGVRFVGEVREEDGPPALPGAETPAGAASRARRGPPCVAVLPFANLSGDPGQEYFADGITEDIIAALSRHRGLRVVARNSTFAFKGRDEDVRRVGIDLGADYVVAGSVRRAESRLRIVARLAAADTGHELWSERYDRGMQDIFDVQDEITTTIAARVEPEVGRAEIDRSARRPAQALGAWDLFRLGTQRFHDASAEGNAQAQALFRRAIAQDPSLAQAHGFLAYAIVLAMLYFDTPPDDAALAETVAIARRGVELDDRDALTRFMYGRALLASGAYHEAIAELETALNLNPCLPIAYCGLGDSLAFAGRVDEALPHFRTAVAMGTHDPLRWAYYSYGALAHLFAGDAATAAAWAAQATRTPRCHYLGFAHRVAALGHVHDADGVAGARRALLELRPGFSCAEARRRLFYLRRPEQIDAYLDGLRRAGLPP